MLPELLPAQLELPNGTMVSLKNPNKLAEAFFSGAAEVALSVLLALVLIAFGWWFSQRVATWAQSGLQKARIDETVAAFLGSTLRFIIFFTIFVLALTTIGVSPTSVAAILGATGIAIGLALKGTLGHVASGLMLMAHRPFKVGDWVETEKVEGAVKRTGLFSTEINTLDNRRVFIPNTVLWDNVLINHTYNRIRMIKFTFTLPYQHDTEKAFALIRKLTQNHKLILKDPAPRLGVYNLTLNGAECELWVWLKVENYAELRSTFLGQLKHTLEKAKIPLPHRYDPFLSSYIVNKTKA